ncbi:2-phospho-L-lactate transferase [Nakamurella endophytica]|uniref:2-phospho-L-lactate transferase n=1 Tax=Nakamurella endophytica TaxID=1748367 RepID=A0A917SWM6_9ACTN|nr:2-phospho-L-lactate transferase [Nakamurella endophytica]
MLTGGVGGARFLLGVKAYLGWDPVGPRPDGSADRVQAVVNTADDIRLHGLQVCPDLDSCLYTLSGAADVQRGWGRVDETWTVAGELAAYGAEAPWFSLGDRDIATHLVRTRMLSAGYPLSQVTAAIAERWQPGVELLPMTDDRVETHVVVADPAWRPPAGTGTGTDGSPAGRGTDGSPAGTGGGAAGAAGAPPVALHFQEWWVRYQAALPAQQILPVGADAARPGPGVLDALREADLVLLAPSNPVVSVGTILAVPGIRQALVDSPAPVVAVAPLIGGAPVRGHADACLAAIGVASTAEAVGRYYGARSAGGLLDGYLIAEGDDADVPGVRVAQAPLLMTGPAATAAMVARCVELAGVRR